MLGNIKIPVLVACGCQDMNLHAAQHIANAIPNSKFELMEMTGHGSPFYRPELFASIVNNFNSELKL